MNWSECAAMKARLLVSSAILMATLAAGACVTNVRSTQMARVETDGGGRPRAFQNTTTYAVHLVFGRWRLLGDGQTGAGVENFIARARSNGDDKVHITNVNTNIYWWVLPPISFVLTPIVTDAYGFVYR